jgi:uncharacterized protein YunC (DUF1805 family)
MKPPQHTHRELTFRNGTAIGISNKWTGGQYCAILTSAGIVGCGIYDMRTPAEFNQAIAIARGTPANPLVEPEDLFEARIVDCTPLAKRYGIRIGMTGREAVEQMLASARQQSQAQAAQQ